VTAVLPTLQGANKIMSRSGEAQPGRGPVWLDLSQGSPAYRGKANDGGQAWLLTFTDLTALMLTFFVLLYSMSTINDDDWQNLIEALSPRLSSVQEVTVAMPSSDRDAEAVERIPGTDLDYLANLLKEQVKEDEILARAEIDRGDERIVLSLPGDLLFASGSTVLNDKAQAAIFALGGVLRNLSNVVEVAGYADPAQPKRTFTTNWELSLARAAALSEMLATSGYQGEILVRGYGHGQYQTPPDGRDTADSMAAARRVDIIIHAYAAERR